MEMLITIAVLAILVTLAVPNFRQFIQNNRLSAQANELVAAMQYARSEALQRGVEVRVCASSDQASCTGNWNQGWIAVADPGGTDEEVLRVWQSPGTDFQLAANGGTVRYQPDGCLSSDGNAQCWENTDGEVSFDMKLEGCTSDNARQVLVERTGRVASQRTECN